MFEITTESNQKINFKIIALMLVAVVTLFFVANIGFEEHAELIEIIATTSTSFAFFGMSLYITKSYKISSTFGKAFGLLSIGAGFYLAATISWYSLIWIFDIEPYPSIADIFYFGFYVVIPLFLMIIVRRYTTITTIHKVWLVAFPIAMILTYGIFSFDYFYGMIFVASSSFAIAASVLALNAFRNGYLFVAWLLIAVSFFISSSADVWYYYLEVGEEYADSHPVVMLWQLSDFLIIYALFKHRKIA